MPPGITEEIIARQPPEAQAIIRALLADNAELKARIEALERQAKGKTPQNSSLPPSTQHPHARPQPPRRKSKKSRGGRPGHKKHERLPCGVPVGKTGPRLMAFTALLLTVVETCRQQGHNAFAFVTAAVEAHFAHQSAPSLLPGV